MRVIHVVLPLVAVLGCKASSPSSGPEDVRAGSDEVVATAEVLFVDGVDRGIAQRAADYEARWVSACYYGAAEEVRVDVVLMLKADGSLLPFSFSTNSRASADCVSEQARHWHFSREVVRPPAWVGYAWRIDREDAESSGSEAPMFRYKRRAPETEVVATVTSSDVFDLEIADRIVQSRAQRLGACHHTEAQSSELAFVLDVGGDGVVVGATLADERVVPIADCLSRQMKLWMFPPTPYGVPARVSVEFSFVERA